jgi:hypothetical protein
MSKERMTFSELVKDWILAMPRIRRIMFERARPLAETAEQKAVITKIWTYYCEDMRMAKAEIEREGGDSTHQDLILQVSHDSMYAGPLLHGRFQVMESVTPRDTYYLVDHTLPDLLYRGSTQGDTMRFASIKEAEDRAALVAGGQSVNVETTRVERVLGRRKETMMAKKDQPAQPAEKKERAPSASSRFKELIMANATAKKPLNDDEIFDKVAGEFNLDEKKRTYVAWYRNDMKKKGMNPPDPVGGAKPATPVSERVAKMQAAKAAKAAAKAPPAPPAPVKKGKSPTGAAAGASTSEKASAKATTAAVEAARAKALSARGRKGGRDAAA